MLLSVLQEGLLLLLDWALGQTGIHLDLILVCILVASRVWNRLSLKGSGTGVALGFRGSGISLL